MFLRLLLLFTIVPVLELALLLRIGRYAGLLPTLVLVLGTGVLGAALAKREGLRAWRRVQDELGQGRPPTDALVDGLLIFAAGVVLLTPGLLTDVAGFLLLLPVTRTPIRRALVRRLSGMVTRGVSSRVVFHGAAGPGSTAGTGRGVRTDDDPRVIVVEARDEAETSTGEG